MSLRIVACNALVLAYEIVAEWAERHGHEIVLVVTSPAATAERYGASYLNLVDVAAPKQPMLITSKLRAAAPLIAAAQPDLLISATFPHKLPARVLAIPRLGICGTQAVAEQRAVARGADELLEALDLRAAGVHRVG